MSQAQSKLQPETRKALREAGLRYADTQTEGFSRKAAGKGFAFYDLRGELIPPSETRQRIKALAIPPAWTDVWIAPRADYHIQATGFDEATRKQYIYHANWSEARARMNFARLKPFGENLPRLRAAVYRRLRSPHPDRETVIAAVVRLLDDTLVRVGNLQYTRENDSYGLTTLERDHISRAEDDIRLAFTGKSGVERDISLHDPLLSELIENLEAVSGKRVFRYQTSGGDWQPVTADGVNDFISEHAGKFTAKDFRPWGGTVTLTDALCQFARDSEPSKRRFDAAVRLAAERLGNTPAVAKAHYLHPAIGQRYLSGKLPEFERRGRQLAEDTSRLKIAEGIVLEILSAES